MLLSQIVESTAKSLEAELTRLAETFKHAPLAINILDKLLEIGELQDHEFTVHMMKKAGTAPSAKLALELFQSVFELFTSVKQLRDKQFPGGVDSIVDIGHLESFLLGWLEKVTSAALMDEKFAAQLLKHASKTEIEHIIQNSQFADKKSKMQLQLNLKKAAASKKDRSFFKKNDIFIFIGRTDFVERPEGSGNFKKTLQIESLVKMDPFSADSHTTVSMMQLRAKFQGEQSQVYKITLPKGAVTQSDIDNPPDWLIDVIDRHKEVVR